MAKKEKIAKYDYQKSSLPKNRKEQFFDLLNHNYSLLIELGLLLFLFFIPFFLSIVIKDMSILAIISSEETDTEIVHSMNFTSNFIYALSLIITFPILSIGVSGVSKILKNLIYSEPIFFWSDFKDGIIENIKSILTISIFVGLFSFLGQAINLSFSEILIQTIGIAINYAFIYPVAFIYLFVSSTYKNSFMVNLKTSLIFYIKFFIIIVLFYFSIALISLVKLIPIGLFFVKYIAITALFIFFIPMMSLATFCYLTHQFDEHINKEQFQDFYQKGLYK